MAEKKRDLFTRASSGLVREVSTLNALAFNIGAETGGAASTNISFMIFGAPAVLLFALPPYTWGSAMVGAFCIVNCLIFVVLTTAMPRTGGDYIFSSRIMHPFLGWIEAWTFVGAMLPFIAFEVWLGVFATYVQFASNALVIPNSFWGSWAALMQSSQNMLIICTIVLVLVAVMTMLPTKTYHKILTSIIIVAIFLTAVLGVAALFVDQGQFATNFQKYLGITIPQLIADATAKGWSPGEFSVGALGPLMAWMLLMFFGFEFSAFMAGELKGNVARNTTIATLGALAWVVFMQGFYQLPIIRFAGLDMIYSWSYLYWNGLGAPLGVAPYSNTLIQIAMPELTSLWTLEGIVVGGIMNVILGAVFLATCIRMLFAFSMDRMLPKKLADVDDRTHSPLYLTIIVVVIAFVFLVQTIYGVSPSQTIWYTAICSFLFWIFPGFNAIFLPYRRRDLYELVSKTWKKKVIGVPLITVLGVIWVAFSLYVYTSQFLLPLATNLMYGGMASLTSVSGGIGMTVAVVASGIVWYLVAYYYNKSKGIDMALLYRTIPPD